MPNNVWIIVSSIGTLISAIAIAVTVLFVWKQLGYIRQGIKSTSYHSTYNVMIEIDQFFFDHPKILPFFRDGTELDRTPNGVTREQVLIAAEMLMDYFDNVFHQQETSPTKGYRSFEVFMQDTFRNSPALQTYLNTHKSWYPEEFIKMVISATDQRKNKLSLRL